MLSRSVLVTSLIAGACAGQSAPSFKNLIVFGDSYTDEGRLNWISDHNGTLPPAGTVIPTSNMTASGGYTWPHYASQVLGTTTYNYAVAGAVCSNEITPRWADFINQLYPSVIDYEVPAFKADVEFSRRTNTTTFRDLEDSVYAIAIGGNDLGNQAFLLDEQVAGKTISDYIGCVWSSIDELYSIGARSFVLFTLEPFYIAPLYVPLEDGGSGNVNYWEDKTNYNTTELQQKLREYMTTVNTAFDYGVPFLTLLEKRWPNASMTLFDAHKLVIDAAGSAEDFLTAPANTTGFYTDQCSVTPGDGCVDTDYPLSSFFWYDSLHPSPPTQEVVGKEFAKVIQGNSTYATYYCP